MLKRTCLDDMVSFKDISTITRYFIPKNTGHKLSSKINLSNYQHFDTVIGIV